MDVRWDATHLSIGQVAERAGVAVTALRFYEAEGLITSERDGGNRRRYRRDTLRRVAMIRVAQKVGIPLGRIREALDTLPHDRAPTVAEWEVLSGSWRDELDERISALQELRDRFVGCVGCGCLSLRSCGLANPYDELGGTGPGPRRLRAAPRVGDGEPAAVAVDEVCAADDACTPA